MNQDVRVRGEEERTREKEERARGEKEEEQEEKKKEREKKQKERGERQASKRQAKAKLSTCRGNKVEATGARVTRSKSGSVKALADLVSNLDINETDEETDGDESEAECPGCGLVYGSLDDNEKWV